VLSDNTAAASDDDGVKEEAPETPINLKEEDFVYLLEPPNNSLPSCLIVFTGGAGLGTYPQIAYNELLLRISNRLYVWCCLYILGRSLDPDCDYFFHWSVISLTNLGLSLSLFNFCT
jgi:hypothetical protein